VSDNEEIVHQKVYSVDWDNSCRDKLAYFKKQGMPDLAKTRPEEVFKMKRMYLGGSTYREVAMTFHKKLPLVLFLSEREKWYQEKAEKAEMIAESLIQNHSFIRADNTLFVTELITFWKEYYRKQIQEYNRTQDGKIVQSLDLKSLERCLKLIEFYEKSGNSEEKLSAPLISFNLGPPEKGSIMNIPSGDKTKLDSSKVFEFLAEMKKQKDDEEEENA